MPLTEYQITTTTGDVFTVVADSFACAVKVAARVGPVAEHEISSISVPG